MIGIFIFFWNSSFFLPLKVFVVYLHEISHGLAALITGGKVKAIYIGLDESGFALTQGGNFLAIASGGYIGSMLWGSLMLYSALKQNFYRALSILLGVVLLFFTLIYPDKLTNIAYFSGLGWGILFILTALINAKVNHFIVFIMGGLTSLYSLYDLADFFGGHVDKTDAGIIAKHYLASPTLQLILAYTIGILISVTSIFILYKFIQSAFSSTNDEEDLENTSLNLNSQASHLQSEETSNQLKQPLDEAEMMKLLQQIQDMKKNNS